MVRRALTLVAAFALTAATTSDYQSARKKFQSIDQGKARGEVRLAERELQAYVEKELPEVAPPGIRSPVIDLQPGLATGKAWVDFLKIRAASGAPKPGWILRQILEGEHQVEVTARVRSAAGQATVDVQRVEIGGIPISGGALDYLIRHYLIPRYPKAKIGRPFEIGHGIERLDVRTNEVAIVMK